MRFIAQIVELSEVAEFRWDGASELIRTEVPNKRGVERSAIENEINMMTVIFV